MCPLAHLCLAAHELLPSAADSLSAAFAAGHCAALDGVLDSPVGHSACPHCLSSTNVLLPASLSPETVPARPVWERTGKEQAKEAMPCLGASLLRGPAPRTHQLLSALLAQGDGGALQERESRIPCGGEQDTLTGEGTREQRSQ